MKVILTVRYCFTLNKGKAREQQLLPKWVQYKGYFSRGKFSRSYDVAVELMEIIRRPNFRATQPVLRKM